MLETNERKCTNIELWRLIEKFNYNHAVKISIAENELGYKALTIGSHTQEPMSIRDALYFVKGLKYAKELTA